MQQSEWENLASLLSLVVGVVTAGLLFFDLIPARWIAAGDRAFGTLSRSPITCFILLAALSFTVNLLITMHKGIPLPVIHDEFSYLLAADTFAHGRITNPTLPFWTHFETPQQLMQPTYMSKYPPAQGLALAVGQVAAGQPIVGVWFSSAAATVAIYWMLLAFLPRPWALLGGVVTALHPELLDWSQNYWGGSVAVLGGAVLLGAWGRLMISSGAVASIATAAGLLILANSRPYEGLIFAAPLLIGLVFRRGNRWFRLLMPGGILLLTGAAAMGYSNFRITGHVLRMPFVEYAAQYDVYPKFWFLPTRPIPVYRNPAMEFIHRYFEKGLYEQLRTFKGFISISGYRARELIETHLKLAVLLLPLTIAVFIQKQRRLIWVWITACVFLLGLLAENFVLPHYEAPLLPAMVLLILTGWEWMSHWTRGGRPLGKMLARATAVGFLAGAVMAAAQPVSRDSIVVDQTALVNLLPTLQSGRQLIFVKYNSMHSFHIEFVHNLSNLENSPIIWARSFGPEADAPVAQHFSGRRVWLLTVTGKLDLSPYLENSQAVK